MDIPISDRAAAAFLLARLTRCGWRFALDGAGDLAVTFGDDPPRWSQQEAMAHVVRLLEEVKTLVRGWPDAPGSATTVHWAGALMDVVPETLASLRKANQELRHAVQTLRDQLQVETQRADLSAKAAQDAWQFARVALKTGRSTMNGS